MKYISQSYQRSQPSLCFKSLHLSEVTYGSPRCLDLLRRVTWLKTWSLTRWFFFALTSSHTSLSQGQYLTSRGRRAFSDIKYWKPSRSKLLKCTAFRRAAMSLNLRADSKYPIHKATYMHLFLWLWALFIQ